MRVYLWFIPFNELLGCHELPASLIDKCFCLLFPLFTDQRLCDFEQAARDWTIRRVVNSIKRRDTRTGGCRVVLSLRIKHSFGKGKNVVQCTRYFKYLATRDTFDTAVRMPQIWDTPASSRLITTTDTEVSRVASFKPGKTLTGWIPFCTFCAIFALAALLLAAEQTEE